MSTVIDGGIDPVLWPGWILVVLIALTVWLILNFVRSRRL